MIGAVLAAGLVVTGPAYARDHRDDHDGDKAAAAIAGVAIVGAIAAAAASKNKHRDHDWQRYEYEDRHHYRHDWGATFRPADTQNTICYRRTRQCYTKGQYSRKWTLREFGYYGR
ncbi:MAG: hypothetical protein KDE55_20855 [Novosphingobium sp.]|nr:hypothetical protein [Novosphingobium sp.]